MEISETAPLTAHSKQSDGYDLDLPAAATDLDGDGERLPFYMDTDQTEDGDNSSDTSYPDSEVSELEGLRPTNVAEAAREEPAAWRTLLGMVLVAVGTALFCTNGAIVQKHGGSILQLMLGRYAVQNIISSAIWVSNPWNIKRDAINWYGDGPQRRIIWLRGFTLFATVFLWWRGLELVPLGDGESILFLSPMATVIAARILLKEDLPFTFAVTTMVSFAGLTFICQPSFIFAGTEYAEISWEGVLYLVAAVLCWSASCVMVRCVKTAHWLQLEMAVTVQSILLWCPLLIVVTQFVPGAASIDGGAWSFSWDTWLVIAILGVFSFTALMCNVIGYQLGDATKVAWMEYLDLVFAFLYQWLYEQDVPDKWEIIGCLCLLSTCFINLGEELYHFIKSKRSQQETEEKYLIDGATADGAATAHSTPERKMCSGDEHEPLLKLVLPATEVRYRGANEYLSIQH